MILKHLYVRLADKKFRFNYLEFAGALGDTGTLVPIFIGLVAINGLNPGTGLLLIGLFYIISGAYYNLPIPVQPLKAMAAIAIAMGLSLSVISASGILIGIILLVLSTTGLINSIVKIFTKPIIRGIQLGVGLMLIKTSWILITKSVNIVSSPILLNNQHIFNWLVIFGGIIIMLIFLWNKRFPASTGILSFGIMASIISGQTNPLTVTFFDIQKFNLIVPSLDDFIKAFFLLVIPQIPLTLGNSIIATKDLAREYFGKKGEKVTEHSLCNGLGITNIIAGFTGAIPVCHGSGGLTAHYSFGARTGGSSIIIGLICVILSIIFGRSTGEIFRIIPHSILGIMLIYVGLRHAFLIIDLKKKQELFLCLGIGIIGLLTGNLAIAFIAGILFETVHKKLELK